MRPRSDPQRLTAFTAAAALTALGALVASTASSCGTLGARSTGDVDLPLAYIGPFQPLTSEQAPQRSRALVSSDEFRSGVDEPSVVTFGGRRVAYTTYTAPGVRGAIARAAESPMREGTLIFDPALPLLRPELPWEGDAVVSPCAFVASPGELVLVYAANGSIGLARSADGMAFTRAAAPVLTADTTRGEALQLEAPAIARAPDGRWYLAYASGGQIFAARAAAPEGPWERLGVAVAPDTAAAADAGTAFESVAVGDPALAIVTTPAERTLFLMFYTAIGPAGTTSVVGAAATYDPSQRECRMGVPGWCRVGRPVYSERMVPARAGSFELVDERTQLLWVGTVVAGNRVISAGLGPTLPRVGASIRP